MMRRIVLFTLVLAGFISIPAIANATNSQLLQQILPTDCILTIVTTENGQQVVGECPTEAPIVTSIETSVAGQRIVRGLFDSVRTTLLKVTFRGVEYTAGTPGSPFTVAGDSWTFSIDEAAPDTLPGHYLLEVEALLVDGRILSTSADFELPAQDEVNPDTGFEPGAPNAGGLELAGQVARPSYLSNSLSPVDTVANGLYRPIFMIDDTIGRPLAATVLTEYGRAAIVVVAVVIVIAGQYLVASITTFFRRR